MELLVSLFSIIFTGILGMVLTAPASAGNAPQFTVVEDGRPVATVVIPADLQGDLWDQTIEALGVLNISLQKMTGTRLTVVNDDDPEAESPGPKVHIGHTKFVESLNIDWDALDWDGFIIKTVGDNLVLAGRNPHGTAFAVYRFLFKYGGIRWYFPTELGEHIPKRDTWKLPPVDEVEEPDFLSRQFSAAAPFDRGIWEKRNLMRPRFSFHHNLLRVFTPDLYEKHPEWFPLRDGVRYKPKGESDHGWQPCMSNEEAAKYAGRVAARYFDEHPEATSFSLGINDSMIFCQCERCQALITPGKTFRGRPDYSDLVFTFMNRAAEELVKTHPDKYLGCLAYGWCENVPSFPVHPNVIPYLTNDRAMWLDPAFRADDQDLIRRWSAVSPHIGIYDYYYGSGYVIPRLFPHLIGESLKFAKDNNVDGFYAEIYTNWSLDGPKAWVAAQLLWDADQDVDELLNDYYTNCFQEAAEPMRRYFELCERQWMDQKGPFHWFKYFFDGTQLELFPPDVCEEARRYLDEALAMAKSDIVRRRVELYSEGFHYTELYSTVYHLSQKLKLMQIADATNFEDAMASMRRLLTAKSELDRYYRDVILSNDLHKPVIPFEERAQGLPAIPAGALAKVKLWADEHGKASVACEFLADIAREFPNTAAGAIAGALTAGGFGPELVSNPSFEDTQRKIASPVGPDWSSSMTPPGWASWFRPGTSADLRWTAEEAHSGKFSVKISGATAASFIYELPVKPGESYIATIFVKAKVSGRNKTQFRIQWKDASGKWVNAPVQMEELSPGVTDGWVPLTVAFRVPDGVYRAVILPTVYDQAPGDYAYFDDLSVRRVMTEQ